VTGSFIGVGGRFNFTTGEDVSDYWGTLTFPDGRTN
jgi:hypothetical protein